MVEEINNQIEKKSESIRDYKDEIVKLRRFMWEELPHTTVDMDGTNFEDVNAMEQQLSKLKEEEFKHEFYYGQIQKLKRSLDAPYFARVDFKEEEEEIESIYIGLSTLFKEDTQDIMVYDWRAPISSIYYDYELGKASYLCENGKIEGDISLKRQFKILNSKLKYMFDSNIKIDDEILQEILSKNSDTKMKSIVTTIQKEQNKVIRDDKNQLLIVQGAAGSGKTSIALHRVAYLIYRYRNESIGAKNIIIFSPNEIFNDYISDVLPQLGEQNMQQTTFFEYASTILGDEYIVEDSIDQMEYLLSSYADKDYKLNVKGIKYKGSNDFLQVIKRYIKYLEEEVIKFHDIVYRGKVIETKESLEELFYDSFSYWPIKIRLTKIRNRIFDKIKPLQKIRLKEIEEEMKFKANFEHEIKPLSRLQRYREFKPLMDDINNMTSIDTIEVYKNIFKDKDLFMNLSNLDHSIDELNYIGNKTINNIENKFISYEDVSPILMLKAELEGTLRAFDIKHVVIDEAQDYTPFQYEIFKHIFKGSKLTVLGDLNQSIHPYMGLSDYNNIVDIFSEGKKSIIKLTKSYRSTREIFNFTKEILLKENNIQTINRPGDKPKIINVANEDKMINKIIGDIKELQEKGLKSIAVICKNAKDSKRVYDIIKDKIDIELITKEDIRFKRGLVVIPSYLSKGLEFDGVLVYNGSRANYHLENERKLFYTMCTRALHNLNIYYHDRLTPFLEGISSGLYETE